jgi:hypothetical protein
MSNYTPEEVNAAVSKIVRSNVDHPTGILGNRDTKTSFNELQEAAAGVFVLYFNAPFYCIKLGTTRVVDYANAQAQTISQLIEAVQATGKLTTPISDISPLANANAALEALGTAVASRKDGFQNIQDVPSFKRYSQAINQFVQQGGGNIKTVSTTIDPDTLEAVITSSVTDTSVGARAQIPGLVTSMQTQHQDLISRVGLLANAMADFGAMNLPQATAQGVISRSSDVLKEHYNTLASQDENTRLTNLRAIMLDLLTQQPLVQKFGAALAPSEFIRVESTGTAYSDSVNLSTPAVLVSDIQGPYEITQNNQFVRITVDGGTPIDYPLPLGYVASLSGNVQEPFTIINDPALAANNALSILFDDPNVTTPLVIPVTLTLGGAVTSTTVAADINAACAGTDLRCERSFYPLKYNNLVTVASLGGNNARFTPLAGSLFGLGVTVGDELDIITGPNIGTTWTITAVDAGGAFVDAVGAAPVTPVSLPSDIEVKIGPAARALTLIDTNAAASLNLRRTIRLLNTDLVANNGAASLGWIPGMESRSRPVAARDLAKNISLSTSTVTATAVFQRTHYAGTARSDATNAGIVVLSKLQAEGTITGGTNVVFTAAPGTDLSGIHLFDSLVVRSTTTAGDVNIEGVITDLDGMTIDVVFPNPITAGSVGIEVGPSFIFHFGDVLNITDGNNQGRYFVREAQGVGTTCSFEVPVESALPAPRDGSNPVSFNVEFGAEFLAFGSRLPQITSRVQVENPPGAHGAEYFFFSSSLPASAYGTTPYLQFGSFPSAVESGDLILIYQTDLEVVDRTFVIADAVSAAGVRAVKISPEIESTASYQFKANLNPPFARIRVAKVANYQTLKTDLDAWLAAAPQQTSFFRDLARVLNPVLLNTRPTGAEVNNAVNQLQALQISLSSLLVALNSYVSPIESAVDALLASFRDKGSDRAIDLLLSGQFSAFFGLDMEGTSYVGTLIKSTRDLAANDLPVRKTNRTNLTGQTSIGVIPNEKDFEFTSDDADSPDTPDIPVGADVVTPGASY